ncbi:TolC family protein [Sulfurimonas sp. SAG-AH-194-I05]|nr:TolC family protein [Sulfurimonas sp. SAG-AH-194-I05]MDF1875968.1 TolC family protein [Sulfurimonas sp. SAG-AH-194-I05]
MQKKLFNIHFLSFFIFLFINIPSLYAQTGKIKILEIKDAIEIAMKDNPELAQIDARYKAMNEIPSQVATLPDPVLTLGLANFPTDTFSRTQEAMTQLQIGMSQQFPFPGKLTLRKDAAQLEANAASFLVDEMRLKLQQSIANTWWEIFYFDRALETIAINQVLIRQFIKVAQTKYEDGQGLQQDILLAQLELSKTMDQKIIVVSLRRLQVVRLSKLMGTSNMQNFILPSKVEKTLQSLKDENTLYKISEQSRPILHFKKKKLLASNVRVSLAKKEYYPDFKLSVLYGQRSGVTTLNDARSDLVSVMLGVKIPLYIESKQSKAVEQRISEQHSKNYALADERLQIYADISSSVAKYKQAKEQFLLLEKGIIPQARQTVDSMLVGYRVNKVDFLNLIRSQVTLFNYQLQYWRIFSNSKQAARDVQAAIGKESIYE